MVQVMVVPAGGDDVTSQAIVLAPLSQDGAETLTLADAAPALAVSRAALARVATANWVRIRRIRGPFLHATAKAPQDARPGATPLGIWMRRVPGSYVTLRCQSRPIDEQGREMLSFVPGDVPRNPLPPRTADEEVLVALARLIRALHEASAGWVPPPGAVWGGTPATTGPVTRQAELVSHRDYHPGNVVFRDGLPV